MNTYFKPRQQGDLDSLCGLYSIVNAAGTLTRCRIGCEGTGDLFGALLKELEAKRCLADVMEPNGGIGFRLLGELVDAASSFLHDEYGFSIERTVASKTYPASLGVFWDSMARHVEEHGPGSVILRLSGKHEHWTCVSEASDRQIRLIDSDDLKVIPRDRATVSSPSGRRQHVLWATQSYFLRLV